MFIDASAAVAIILDEPERELLRGKLKSTRHRYMSSIADYETVMAVRRGKQINTPDSYAILRQFQHIFAIKHLGIEERHTAIALEAFEQFGKGQSRKVGLNMGDCFSYACAKAQKVPLLFKGEDFVHTDIRIA